MKKKKQQLAYQPNLVTTFIFMGVIVVGLIISLFMMGQRQELRKKAAGNAQTAVLVVDPAVTAFPPGTYATIFFSPRDAQHPPIDGIQLQGMITGTIPPNVVIATKAIPGLRLLKSTLETTDKGKRFTIVYVTENPTKPVILDTEYTKHFASLQFKAPPSGSMTLTFDPIQTLITQYQITANILQAPSGHTYLFAIPTNTPTPTPTPFIRPPRGTPTPGDPPCNKKVICPNGGSQTRINGRCGCPQSGNPKE